MSRLGICIFQMDLRVMQNEMSQDSGSDNFVKLQRLLNFHGRTKTGCWMLLFIKMEQRLLIRGFLWNATGDLHWVKGKVGRIISQLWIISCYIFLWTKKFYSANTVPPIFQIVYLEYIFYKVSIRFPKILLCIPQVNPLLKGLDHLPKLLPDPLQTVEFGNRLQWRVQLPYIFFFLSNASWTFLAWISCSTKSWARHGALTFGVFRLYLRKLCW